MYVVFKTKAEMKDVHTTVTKHSYSYELIFLSKN